MALTRICPSCQSQNLTQTDVMAGWPDEDGVPCENLQREWTCVDCGLVFWAWDDPPQHLAKHMSRQEDPIREVVEELKPQQQTPPSPKHSLTVRQLMNLLVEMDFDAYVCVRDHDLDWMTLTSEDVMPDRIIVPVYNGDENKTDMKLQNVVKLEA